MKEAPERTGMTINGQRMDLTHFLFDVMEKPIPKSPTHYALVEVLNTDLSVKRITIYFNPTDTWRNNTVGNNNDFGVGQDICEGLSFLGRDPNTLAYRGYIIDIATNEMVHKGFTYNCNKCKP